jgi:type IV pilus assembly protein PilY1
LPAAALLTAGVVMSAGAPAPNTLISLANEPLYSRGVRAKPALALALSVEFPTTGQTYQGAYVPDAEYIGYFDATSCYTYNDTKKQYDSVGRTTSTGTGTTLVFSHLCNGTGFSGNFMNWATSSAIDILRYGMTGGDRIVDTATETVLQRAVLQSSFYNGSNFVSKSISAATAANALPSAMLSGRTVTTVYVANCLNRIHFGTSSTGSCGSPGDNSNLGTAPISGSPVAGVSSASGKPSDVSNSCAGENQTCSFSGQTREVWYGANSSWYYKTFTGSVSCSNGVFGDPISGTVKNCYIRSNSNTTPAPTPSGSVLTNDGYFLARVSVCNSSAGILVDPRTAFCTRYPNGAYKPTGNLQKYSDTVRVAAMGYLNDSSGSRYGGVLRAPMKYVGPKTFDANFNLVAGTNPKREWDESTGIFIQNPEGNSNPDGTGGTAISGVINYLNQFGRTGTTQGAYKTYDPVGELYYETLRYLQGLPPTPQAISGLTPAFKDGYPVYTNWDDPLPQVAGLDNTGDYSCVRANILTIGDVHTHYDRSLPGNTVNNSTDFARPANPSNNEPNFAEWTKKAGDLEKLNNLSTDTSQDDGNYFMVGAAYWAHTQDFRGTAWTTQPERRRPGMRVKTYMIDVDEYGQSSASFGARKNTQFFLTAKYGGFNDVSKTGDPFKNATGGSDLTSNWQQSNGDANTYFLAGNPVAMLASISQIFQQIAEEANSIAGGALNTTSLSTADADFYQAQFDPTYWSGDLVDSVLARDATGALTNAAPTVRWSAADLLTARSAAQPRNLVVGRHKDDVSSTGAGTAFVWGSLDARAQTALRTPAYATSATAVDSAASGIERVDYLRGDRSKESPTGIYRKRNGLMGDVVNSGAVFKGAPTAGLTDTGYAAFYNSQFDSTGATLLRRKAVYIGANDGMLHAFDAVNGNELFGYIPSFLVPYLSNLTDPSYVHRSYVDATPVVAEAQIGTASSPAWKTVLVGGAGGGGQGVYALDVTDPANFSAANVLWEFTDLNDPDLGNVVGEPKVVKIRTSPTPSSTSTGTSVPTYKWYAVVASGVNSNAADGSFNEDGRPALFFLELGKARTTQWQQGVNYFKLRFAQTSTSMAYGMTSFNVTLGAAGELARLYAGDLQGNFWKLNFATAASSNGYNVDVSSLLSSSTGSATVNTPFYVARAGAAATSPLQPITSPPAITYGINSSLLVSFATGKFLEPSDIAGPYTGQIQSVYTLADDDRTAIANRGQLALRTPASGTLSGSAFSYNSATVPKGWYFDFPGSGSGERQISGLQVLYSTLYFNTIIPAQGGCDPGTGNFYQVDVVSGTGRYVLSAVGMPGPADPTENAATVKISKADSTGRRIKTVTTTAVSSASAGTSTGTPTEQKIPTGRLSWRQIMNYQELHRAP